MFFNRRKIKTKRLIGEYFYNQNDGFDPYLIFKNEKNERVCKITIIEKSKKSIEFIFKTFENHRQKGYMTEALNECLKIIFKNNPKMIIENYVSKQNFGSLAFHEKFGFVQSIKDNNCYLLDKNRFDKTAPQRKEILEKAWSKFEQNPISQNLDDALFENNFLKNFNL